MPKPTRIPAGPLLGAPNAWFFKLMGESDAVLREVPAFTGLVRSLQFSDDGTPHYQIPEKWIASNGPPPRYQTLKLTESNPPLEVTVSTLPVNGNDISQYLFANINRWREQIGLKVMDEANWMDTARAQGEVIVVPSNSKLVALVNLNGETKETGSTRMLAAIVIDGPANLTETTPAPAKSPVTYTRPEGWKESAGNAMRLASLEATAESGKVDISVTRLGGGGDTLSNINRWREQVKLEAWKEEELKDGTVEMEIDGRKGTYVEAIGPEQAILAVIIPEGESKWFFKAQGPVAAIEAERERFKQFLTSSKLQSP
ncbi:MAG TPA: hypothetical protein VNQ76_05085 [Planctomicrobium sp.]|nr:hypothetical protein [Planctomicrobium sp.]